MNAHPPMPAATLRALRWLAAVLLSIALPLSALPPVQRHDACAAQDVAGAVRALSRAASALLEGRPVPAPACPRERGMRRVRDAMTPALP